MMKSDLLLSVGVTGISTLNKNYIIHSKYSTVLMRNLNRKNGSSSSVVVRPRLLPTALAILMKMYSNIQVENNTRLVW